VAGVVDGPKPSLSGRALDAGEKVFGSWGRACTGWGRETTLLAANRRRNSRCKLPQTFLKSGEKAPGKANASKGRSNERLLQAPAFALRREEGEGTVGKEIVFWAGWLMWERGRCSDFPLPSLHFRLIQMRMGGEDKEG